VIVSYWTPLSWQVERMLFFGMLYRLETYTWQLLCLKSMYVITLPLRCSLNRMCQKFNSRQWHGYKS